MKSSPDWFDKKYNEVFETETIGLERRRQRDPNFDIAEAEAQLQHLYALDGMDSGGRGTLQDSVMAATLAAWEAFIAHWKAEKK